MIPITIRKGTQSQILAATDLRLGELCYATDLQQVFIHNGFTQTLVGNVVIGNYSDRPAPGVLGRLFYAEDENKLYSDLSSHWTEGFVGQSYVDNSILTTSGILNQTINTVSGVLHQSSSHSHMTVEVGPYADFTSIQAAIDSITVANLATDFWDIRIFPGTYNENIVLKDGVSIVGISYDCIINGTVMWPADRCTDGNWSSLINIGVTNYPTTSGEFSVLTSEAGYHDLMNSWFYLEMDVDPIKAKFLQIDGGEVHGYSPQWEMHVNCEMTPDSQQCCVCVASGTYHELTGDALIYSANSLGNIMGYSLESNSESHISLIGSQIRIYNTAPTFYGNVIAFKNVNLDEDAFQIKSSSIELSAQQGGYGYGSYLDSSAYGNLGSTLLSHSNRIQITGFQFNYSSFCQDATDQWVSHFDTIEAADGFHGDPASLKMVHADSPGNLHMSGELVINAPTGSAKDIISVDYYVDDTQNQRLTFTPNYHGYDRLTWRNPSGPASIAVQGAGDGPAMFNSTVQSPNAYDKESRIALWQDETPGRGRRGYRFRIEPTTQDYVVTNIWEDISLNRDVMRITPSGQVRLIQGIPVDRFLNESNMASYSSTGLPTQKSVVDYVNTVSGNLAQDALIADQVTKDYVDAYIKPYHYLSVSVSGGDFTKIQDAIDSITIGDVNTDFWAVVVHPGIYNEDIYLKDNVDLIGDSYDSCMIYGSVNWLAASGCTLEGQAWSSIQNLSVQGYTSASGFSTIYTDAGNHDIVNSYVYTESDTVEANCVQLNGGNIYSYLTEYEYKNTGDSPGATHRCVRVVDGEWESQSDNYVMTIADTTNSIVCAGTQRSSDPNDYFRFIGANIDILLTGSGYSGNVYAFRSRGTTLRNSVHGCRVRVTGPGTGSSYMWYVDPEALGFIGNEARSSSNRFISENFSKMYYSHVGNEDHFYSHFDDITAPDGIEGNVDNYSMVSSDTDGQLRLTGGLYQGNGHWQSQNISTVDVGLGNSNPQLNFDAQYYQYTKASWLVPSGNGCFIGQTTSGDCLTGSMVFGPGNYVHGYEPRVSIWTDNSDNLDRHAYRMRKKRQDESWAISRLWTFQTGEPDADAENFVDIINIDKDGGFKLRYGSRVNTIFNENDFASNSVSGIATQSSTKAYVDNNFSTTASSLNTASGILKSYTYSSVLTVSGFLTNWVYGLNYVNATTANTTSGNIINWVIAQDYATHTNLNTTSGVVVNWVTTNYPTNTFLNTVSGNIITYTNTLNNTTSGNIVAWVTANYPTNTVLNTASGNILSYVSANCPTKTNLTTTSGDILSYTNSLTNTTSGVLVSWVTSNYTTLAVNNTTSGNIISYVAATYPTKVNLTTTSGDIIAYTTSLNNTTSGNLVTWVTNNYTTLALNNTTSGNIVSYVSTNYPTKTNLTTTSGDIVSYVNSLNNTTSGNIVSYVVANYPTKTNLTTTSGDVVNYTNSLVNTSSGNIVTWVTNNYTTQAVNSTTSGNIISYVSANYPTKTNLTTTSGDLVTWVTNQQYITPTRLTTTSGDIVNWVTAQSYASTSKLTTTSGDLVAYINSRDTSTSGSIVTWVQNNYPTNTTVNTISGNIVSQIPSLTGYATQTWVGNQNYTTATQVNTISGNIVSQIPSLAGYATQTWTNNNFYTQTQVNTISGNVVAQIPSLAGYATQTWVQNQNYDTLTQLNTTSGNILSYVAANYPTKTNLTTTSGDLASWVAQNYTTQSLNSTTSGNLVSLLSNNGFVSSAAQTISWSDTTRTLTITPTSSSFQIVTHGVQYVITGAASVQIPNQEGAWYIYYTTGGNLVATASIWSFMLDAMAAYVYWDVTNQKAIVIASELHSINIDDSVHYYLHFTNGFKWENGVVQYSNATTSGSPNADNRNTWVGFSSGTLFDEDLTISITNVSGTKTGIYQQDLGNVPANQSPVSAAKLPIYYTTAVSGVTVWRKQDPTNFPFLTNASNVPQISTLSGTTWGLTTVASGFFVSWVYATNDINNPVFTIPDWSTYTNLTNAEINATPSNIFNGRVAPLLEMSLMYRLIYEANPTFASGCMYSCLREVDDYRASSAGSVLSASQAVVTHSSLPDLNLSGHPATVINTQGFVSLLAGQSTVQSALNQLDTIAASHTEVSTTSGNITTWVSQNYSTPAQVNTISGNIVSQIPSLAGYATQVWVSNQSYATTTQLNTTSGNIVTWVQNQNYDTVAQRNTTSGNIVSWVQANYPTNSQLSTTSGNIVSQIPSLSGYATQVWANGQFYTQTQVNTISGNIVSQIPSLTGYATQTWVQNQSYATTTQLNTTSGNIVSQIPSLAGYATQTWVQNQSYTTTTQVNTISGNIVSWVQANYPTNNTVNTISGNIVSQIPSLAGYATQTWVTNQNYTTATQVNTISGNIVAQIPSLTGYATQTWVTNQNYGTVSQLNTTSGNIVSWVTNQNYATKANLTTTSGDILSYVSINYPTKTNLTTTSGDLVTWVTNQSYIIPAKLTTTSGDLISYINSHDTSTSGSIVSWVQANYPTNTQLNTSSGNIVSWVQANYPTNTSVNTISGNIVSWVSNQMYETQTQFSTASGNIVSWVNANFPTKTNLTTTSGDITTYVNTRVPIAPINGILISDGTKYNATSTGYFTANSGTFNTLLKAGATWIDSTGRISVGGGNITGVNALQIDMTATQNKVSPFITSLIEIDSQDGNASDFVFRLSGNGYTALSIAKSNGTLAAPTAVTATDNLLSYATIAYDGATWQNNANINVIMDGVSAAGNVPSRYEFQTTPIGSAAAVTRMTIKNDGKVGIGTPTPQEQLDVGAYNIMASGMKPSWITYQGVATDTNMPAVDGTVWFRSDQKDFKSRENSNTLTVGMNSMCQIRQAFGIAQQDCNAGAVINWNVTDVADGLYGHSNTINSSRITVSGTAWYKVTYGVSWVSGNTNRKTVATQVRKNGNTYLLPGVVYAESQNLTDNRATNHSSALYRLSAGDYIEIVASGVGSTGTANTLQDGSTYMMVEFMRWGN